MRERRIIGSSRVDGELFVGLCCRFDQATNRVRTSASVHLEQVWARRKDHKLAPRNDEGIMGAF